MKKAKQQGPYWQTQTVGMCETTVAKCYRIYTYIHKVINWCLNQRSDFELLQYTSCAESCPKNELFSVSEEPWDTEWAEPKGLAAHTNCEYSLFFPAFCLSRITIWELQLLHEINKVTLHLV